MGLSNPVSDLLDATHAFDALFQDDIAGAKAAFERGDSSFHSAGLGVTTFLQALLGLEKDLVPDATRLLSEAELGAKEALRTERQLTYGTRFPAGLEWEILQADAVVLKGVTHVLNESYMGYVQALYALNTAHSKFTKLFQSAFPDGLDAYENPPPPSLQPGLAVPPPITRQYSTPLNKSSAPMLGKIVRWGSSLSVSKSSRAASRAPAPFMHEDGPMDDFILAGAAFGYGLFSLVLSLLPPKVRNVVGWFGFKSDRTLALRSLGVAAKKQDVHSVFAALTLLLYHGFVLQLSSWFVDEEKMIQDFEDILTPIEKRYPLGSLWIINKAKLLRLRSKPEQAIEELERALTPGRTTSFSQADALLIFELAFAQVMLQRYEQAAESFIRTTNTNNWSHATYLYFAAGCYASVNNLHKAQELLDKVSETLEIKKQGSREIPTEAFIRKKLSTLKELQREATGSEANFVDSITISLTEEMSIFWNAHDRLPLASAESRIRELLAFDPPVDIKTPYSDGLASGNPSRRKLTNAHDIGLRNLLLGLLHRVAKATGPSRLFLNQVISNHALSGDWKVPAAAIEMAVLELKEMDSKADADKADWVITLKSAGGWLEKASSMTSNGVDMANRMDPRISMLQEQIRAKKNSLGDS